MPAFFRSLSCAFLTRNAIQSGRFDGLYRKLCRPDGEEWARYLKRRQALYRMSDDCAVQTKVETTDTKHVRLGNNVHLTGCTLFDHDGSINMLKKMTGFWLDCSRGFGYWEQL